MNLIWLSANIFGLELLKEVLNLNIKVKAIITLSEEAETVMYDGINNERWYKTGIDVYEIERINNERQLFINLEPDFVFMVGWRQIIEKSILNLPKKGFIGFHPTLLPKGRGPAPIINSIINGFKETGLTMFYVSDGIDNGDIIGQEIFKILENDYAEDVYNKMIDAGRRLIRVYLPKLIQGKAPRIPQDERKATIFEKRSMHQNRINIKKESIHEIYNKIRALSKPYSGAYIQKNEKKLIIWKAEIK
ncbi:MAG: hypothetical protein GF311_01370 [Candidatus Lokiarchaeota archaeon]|nr:hypothetical protein [Candidatus Lokiarchaeota archaeon]